VVFLTVNLECSRSDCEALVNMLKILIKQLKLDREVCDVCVWVCGGGGGVGSDCEPFVNVWMILIKQLKLDREVCDVGVCMG